MSEENSTQMFVPFMVDVRFGADIQQASSSANVSLPHDYSIGFEALSIDPVGAKGEKYIFS
jgi:hypothetical protein